MNTQIVNLNSPSDRLPAVLCVLHNAKPYYARFLHAEVDHFNKPLPRRPEAFHHDHYHVVLVTAGQGHFYIDGQVFMAAPGKVYFTSPLQGHNFLNARQDQAHYTEITFEWVSEEGQKLDIPFHELLQKWTNQPCRKLVELQASPVFQELFTREVGDLVAREHNRVGVTDLDLNVALFELLMLSYTHCFRMQVESASHVLDQVRNHIRNHYSELLSLNELAEMAKLTPNYLSRQFKRLYGRTPIAYQIDLRMRNACELLRTTDDPLAKVAAKVGFEDGYYFARLFRKRMGYSPGRFRRMMRSL